LKEKEISIEVVNISKPIPKIALLEDLIKQQSP